jgi:hypothetical protein
MAAIDDVFEYIKAQAIAGGNTGWNLLRRRITDTTSDQLVVVAEDGGPEPEIPTAGGIGDSAQEDPAVMVTVRAKAWDGDASRDKADDVLLALHGKFDIVLAPPNGDRYLRIRAQTPAPIFAGYDEQGRPLHTISFRMLRLVGVSS